MRANVCNTAKLDPDADRALHLGLRVQPVVEGLSHRWSQGGPGSCAPQLLQGLPVHPVLLREEVSYLGRLRTMPSGS